MDVKQSPRSDGNERADETPRVRDEKWIRAFQTQIRDRNLYRRAMHFARGCVHTINQCGGLVPSSYAEDLVAEVIADTWQGTLSWDPAKRALVTHIILKVGSRARHEREKAQQFPTIPLDAHEEGQDGDQAAATVAETEAEEAHAAVASPGDAPYRIFARDVFERVRALAAGDLEVLALLEAMRAGATHCADLRHVTGMSVRRYERARRRLDTLLLELPVRLVRGISAAGTGAAARDTSAPERRAA